MIIDFPFSIDRRGRTAATTVEENIRDLIEQVLLISPGERVMRPDFGAGLLAMVFEPGGPEVAAAVQYLVQGSLEQVLADVITVEQLTVETVDAALLVTVVYMIRATQTRGTAVVRTQNGVL